MLLNVRKIAAGPVESAFNAENLRLAYGGKVAFLEAKERQENQAGVHKVG